MRYTNAANPVAAETIQEIGQGTAHFRPNYEGTREEAGRTALEGPEPVC
jgi:DNA gyrase/topoisomerase IV subunit A